MPRHTATLCACAICKHMRCAVQAVSCSKGAGCRAAASCSRGSSGRGGGCDGGGGTSLPHRFFDRLCIGAGDLVLDGAVRVPEHRVVLPPAGVRMCVQRGTAQRGERRRTAAHAAWHGTAVHSAAWHSVAQHTRQRRSVCCTRGMPHAGLGATSKQEQRPQAGGGPTLTCSRDATPAPRRSPQY